LKNTGLSAPTVENETLSRPRLHRGRAVGIVGILTLAAATVGYLREAALAARFGVSSAADAYFAAIFIPNLAYLIIVAGTLSPLFIPILLRGHAEPDSKAVSATFSHVANFVLLLLAAVIALAALTARVWLPLLFAGFTAETTATALRLTYIIFPAVLFLGLAGLMTAALNAFHRFALAAAAPALASVAVIAGVVFARGPNAVYTVAFATAAGFVLQALVLVPRTFSLGIRYRPVFDLSDPAISQLLRLGIPLLLYLLVANASLFVERNLASRLSAGAVAMMTYALRLFTAPANFLAAPLATVTYPDLARDAGRGDSSQLSHHVARVFRLVVFLFLPISILVVINALPLTRVLYERGHFAAADSLVTARVLAFYSIGILPNALALVLLRVFFAVHDTVSPLVIEVVDLIIYVIAASLLAARFGIQGLAIARAGTFILVAILLTIVLSARKHLLRFDRSLFPFLTRLCLACAVMAVINLTGKHLLQGMFETSASWLRLAIVGVLLIGSGAVFTSFAIWLKIPEARQVAQQLWAVLAAGSGAATEDDTGARLPLA
jgi:putative peptidoglycan lipid II flippase